MQNKVSATNQQQSRKRNGTAKPHIHVHHVHLHSQTPSHKHTHTHTLSLSLTHTHTHTHTHTICLTSGKEYRIQERKLVAICMYPAPNCPANACIAGMAKASIPGTRPCGLPSWTAHLAACNATAKRVLQAPEKKATAQHGAQQTHAFISCQRPLACPGQQGHTACLNSAYHCRGIAKVWCILGWAHQMPNSVQLVALSRGSAAGGGRHVCSCVRDYLSHATNST